MIDSLQIFIGNLPSDEVASSIFLALLLGLQAVSHSGALDHACIMYSSTQRHVDIHFIPTEMLTQLSKFVDMMITAIRGQANTY